MLSKNSYYTYPCPNIWYPVGHPHVKEDTVGAQPNRHGSVPQAFKAEINKKYK